jgi:uncharacterized protein
MADLPSLGVGLGYRSPIRKEILQHVRELGFLEVVSDSFFRNEPALRALSTLLPTIPHSLNLSVGSQVEEGYLERIARMVEITRPPWFTDHLAFTQASGLAIGHLAPVPYTEESLERVVANVKRVQARVAGVPFGLENITMPFYWPNNTMEEHVFLREVVRRTGCYLLLDLENVRINGANHGRGGRSFLDKLPLERVVQVHIAGGVHGGEGLEHDTHSAPVSEETWALLEYLCELRRPPGVLLERDGGFPPFPELMAEVRRAGAILAAGAGA